MMKTYLRMFLEAICLSIYYKVNINKRTLNHLLKNSLLDNPKDLIEDNDTSIIIYRIVSICSIILKNRCLVNALVYRKMTTRRHIANTLCIGVQRIDGSHSFHAWVTTNSVSHDSYAQEYNTLFTINNY